MHRFQSITHQNAPAGVGLGSQRDRELLRVEREALEAHRGCEHSRVAREKERRPCRKHEPVLSFATLRQETSAEEVVDT